MVENDESWADKYLVFYTSLTDFLLSINEHQVSSASNLLGNLNVATYVSNEFPIHVSNIAEPLITFPFP